MVYLNCENAILQIKIALNFYHTGQLINNIYVIYNNLDFKIIIDNNSIKYAKFPSN